MKRWLISVAVVVGFAAFACAQESPAPDGQLFSSDLIAWSAMQQPQAPEQPGQQTAPAPSNQTPTASSSAATVTGTISREADGFVLKVSENASYKLDVQRQVEQYEGQRVRVTGTVETGGNLIHVNGIEPLS